MKCIFTFINVQLERSINELPPVGVESEFVFGYDVKVKRKERPDCISHSKKAPAVQFYV